MSVLLPKLVATVLGDSSNGTTMPRGSSVVDSITLAVVVMRTGLMID